MMKSVFILFVTIWGCNLSIQSERRLALVVGNSEYGKQNYLENPVHDAEDIASKLGTMDFEIIKLTNGTLKQMDDAISDFGAKAKSYDVVLFYFSGHGLQSKGENYLMPIDAELNSEADIKYKCFPLNLLLDKLDESNCPMKIVVLDACRNNPFMKRWHRGSGSVGLASVSPPKGTYISFSTAAGSVALDGVGRHSPFTQAFLETLDMPNLSLFDFFNEVGQKVLAETNGEQDPWTNHNTMKGKFFFNQSEIVKGRGHKRVVSVLPGWINEKKDNEWVGVSIPMEDKDEARKMAIINALLKYMSFEGGIQVNLFGEYKTSNIQGKAIDDFSYSEVKNSLDIASFLKYFHVDIKKEYFNNNHEYFVLCTFKKETQDRNIIYVTRKLQVDEVAKSIYVTFSVEALINNDHTIIDYSYSKSSFSDGCHHLLIDSAEIAKPAVIYEDRTLSSDVQLHAYPLINISECGSLGLAELALLAQYPVVTGSTLVNSLSDIVKIDNTSMFNRTALYGSKDMTMPVQTTIAKIKNNHLCVSIQDPYDLVSKVKQERGYQNDKSLQKCEEGVPDDFCQLINSDTIVIAYGLGSDEPVLLKKTMQIFETLGELASHENVRVLSTQDYDSSVSNSKTIITDYFPFFFLDGKHSDLRQTLFVKNGVAVLGFKPDHISVNR